MVSNFFERLQIIIAQKNIKKKDLAVLIGVDQRSLSRWRKSPPSVENMLKIAEATGCAYDWLSKGEGPMFKYQPPPGGQIILDQKSAKPKVTEPPPSDQGEGWNMPEMVKMTMEILASDTVYRSALASNIRAFHQAVNMEKEMQSVNEKLAAMEKQMERQTDEMAGRMARLEEMLLSFGATLPEKREQGNG
ncbi:MAG: hypothetical protein VR65_24870 [Desulfobulbaceae bacterium BRH_c16a]|nr:MAG: hypothetical protein VR65_24870 [Desulfobulbaceae bacterium BRH_c16a]